MDRRTKLGVIGVCVVGAVVFGVSTWRQYQHRFKVSCDERLSATAPQNSCTDYYGDYGEVECGMGTMKHAPCERAGVLGGCHQRDRITWYYRRSDGSEEKWREHCMSGEKELAADWKEPESSVKDGLAQS